MAFNISSAFLAKLENTDCEQLLTFVKVHYPSGSIVYSEQEVLFDTEENQWSLPALMSVGEFHTSLRLNNNGTSIGYTIALDDSDGHLRVLFNHRSLNGVRVDLYLNFEGLGISDALQIGIGTINSDNVVWGEKDRILNFSVENVLFSKTVGFKAYPEMIAGQKASLPNSYFPMVFGENLRVPALQISGGDRATVSQQRVFTEASPITSGKVLYILDFSSGYDLGELIDVKFFKREDIANQPAGFDQTSGRVLGDYDGGTVFVKEGMVVEKTDVNLLPFAASDLVLNKDESFRYWRVDMNPSTESLVDQWFNFEDFDGRPTVNACKVIGHITDGDGHRVELDYQPRWGEREAERSILRDTSFSFWWFNITVNSSGEFSPSIKIKSRAQEVMHLWELQAFNFVLQSRRSSVRKDSGDFPNIREYYQGGFLGQIGDIAISLKALSTNSVTGAFGNGSTTYSSSWRVASGSIPTFSGLAVGHIQAVAQYVSIDETGYNEDSEEVSFAGDPTREAVMVPAIRSVSKYVMNLFTTFKDVSIDAVLKVFASARGSDEPQRIQSSYLTVVHDTIIPNEALEVSVLEINPPLEYLFSEGHFTGEVFIDHPTATWVHDGVGGTINLDTANPISIIDWVIDVYTNLALVKNGGNFDAIQEKFTDEKTGFFLSKETDAFNLVNTIAWENKLALVTFGTDVFLVDLNVEPDTKFDFDVTNVELKSVKLGFVPITEIVTDFRFRFQSKKNNVDGDVLVFNNNVESYGRNTQFIDLLTKSTPREALELAKFWGNRLSRAWRTIEFSCSVEALKLQPYDAVNVSIPALSSNTIIGFIQEVKYQPNSMTTSIKITLASESTNDDTFNDAVTDPSYWLGLPSLRLEGDRQVGIVSNLSGAKLQAFSLTDLNSLKPFERRL